MDWSNYWLELIWLFLFGIVSALLIPKREETVLGRTETRWHWLPALVLVIPFILWAGLRGPGEGGDTSAYINMFNQAPSTLSAIPSFVINQPKDKGYALLEALFKTLISNDYTVFFLFIASVQILCLLVTYRRYSTNLWLSMFFFVASTDYLGWLHNGTRQFLAAALIFAFLPLLLEKKYLAMILVVLLAYFQHATAIIFLPVIFIANGRAWNWKTILFLGAVMASIVFLDAFTNLITTTMEDTAYSGEVVDFLNDDGANIFRVLFYSVPTAMSLVFRRRIEEANDPLINMCVNFAIVSTGIYIVSYFTSGMMVGRLPVYFSLANYILIPWMIREFFKRESAILVTGILIAAYSFFFYYQVFVTWGA